MFTIKIILTYTILNSLNNLAYSQEVDYEDVIDRIERIERNVSDLQKRELGEIDKNLTTGYISRNETRLDSIETTNRTNFGKLEEIENLLKILENKIDLINSDLNQRIKKIEQNIYSNKESLSNENKTFNGGNINREIPLVETSGLDSQNEPAGVIEIENNEPPNENEIKAKYENAIKLLWASKYDNALKELEELRKFKPADLMPNIQYWLGEVYYAKKDFNQAVIEFGEGLKQYPESIKGPDNMLKLGLSFSNLSQKVDACNVLYELEIKYPETPKNILEISNTERKKLGCPEE